MANERPFDIPINNVSNVFVNNYNQFLKQNLVGESDRAFEERNAENDTIIATYDYKEEIKKKVKGIIDLIQDSIWMQEGLEDLKKEKNHLKSLLEEKEKLKVLEKELNEVKECLITMNKNILIERRKNEDGVGRL